MIDALQFNEARRYKVPLDITAREYLGLNEEQDAIEARHRNGQLAPGDAIRLL